MVRINEPISTKPASERLKLLYRISQTINSSLDLDQVMELLMDEVISVTNAERGFLMLFNDKDLLKMHTARGINSQDLDNSESEISRGIVSRVASEGRPLLTSNAQLDNRFDKRASVRLYGLRSVICVPIKSRDKILGIIYVDNRFQNGIFTEEDLDLLNSIASSAAIAIENARLYLLAVDQGRMQRELQMAREVQINLLPKNTPEIEGWEFAACWNPAHEVSGDFYDFIDLPSGKIGIIVADVSDKGMPAALFMTLSRSIIRSVVGQNGFPSEDITKVNQLICQDTAERMFITFFYAEIDIKENTLTYVNAGHNPPLFIPNGNANNQLLSKTGMAAGVDPSTKYEQETIRFSPGDLLLIYTDGVTDLETKAGVLGVNGIETKLSEIGNVGAKKSIQYLEKTVCSFPETIFPPDDITILAVQRKM